MPMRITVPIITLIMGEFWQTGDYVASQGVVLIPLSRRVPVAFTSSGELGIGLRIGQIEESFKSVPLMVCRITFLPDFEVQ